MKKYSKPQIIAKNLRSGSYAAGCPSKDAECFFFGGKGSCRNCDRAK